MRAADVAATLAERHRVELEGLYVEDIDLLNVTGLPNCQEVLFPSGSLRRLHKRDLEDQLASDAAWVRRSVKTRSQEGAVKCSFRVLRGRVNTEILGSASRDDLLVLGMVSRSIGTSHCPGSTAIAAAELALASVFLVSPHLSDVQKAVVVCDSTKNSTRVLKMAAQLTNGLKDFLIVDVANVTEMKSKNFEAETRKALEAFTMAPSYLRVPNPTLHQICQLVCEPEVTLLALPRGLPTPMGWSLSDILAQIRCSVLLVR
jgi:hypothetical protein